MSRPKSTLKAVLLENRLSYSCGVIGGVLLVLVLALIPHNAFADTHYIYDQQSYFQQTFGCNTVSSTNGVSAIGARGGLTGTDGNTTGCGYYMLNNNLTYRNDDIFGACYFDDFGQFANTPYSGRCYG